MDRGASSGFVTEIGKAKNAPFHLFELHLDDATVYMTDAHRAIAWNGNTYHAVGKLLSFTGIEETTELKVTQASFTLSGVDQTLIAAVLDNDYIDRRIVLYKGFFNDEARVTIEPIAIFDGRADQPVIAEDPENGKCIVTLEAASHWVDFERRPGRHTNHEEQQIHFPGDKFFEFASEVNKQILWGRKA